MCVLVRKRKKEHVYMYRGHKNTLKSSSYLLILWTNTKFTIYFIVIVALFLQEKVKINAIHEYECMRSNKCRKEDPEECLLYVSMYHRPQTLPPPLQDNICILTSEGEPNIQGTQFLFFSFYHYFPLFEGATSRDTQDLFQALNFRITSGNAQRRWGLKSGQQCAGEFLSRCAIVPNPCLSFHMHFLYL